MYLPESLTIKNNRLSMESCDLSELASSVGTPCFVISEAQIRTNVARYQEAFSSQWTEGEFVLMPAFKACPIIAIRRLLTELGCGADVFGPGELEGVLRGGVSGPEISVNGSIKDRELLEQAAKVGARVVLDSPQELEWANEIGRASGCVIPVLFRIKPYLENLDMMSDFVPDMSIRELTQIIKYGIPSSEVAPMGPRSLEMTHVQPVGVHVHMGRHSKSPEVWSSWVQHCVYGIKQLSDSMDGWTPSIIDLGGGIASFPDRDTDVAVTGYPAPELEELAATICQTLRNTLAEVNIPAAGIRLELEPGRGLHSDTGVHLTKVRNIKEEHNNLSRKWIELDTSEVFLGVGSINQSPPFDFLVANKAGQANTETVDLVGKTCNAEMLYLQVETPSIEREDTIVLLHTGAYAEPSAANFNALPRPGTVLVNGESFELIRRHETVDDVYQRDAVPARFA
ncbi:MAG: hypothetical protein V7746_04300 [Halioglobus sp.]